MFTLSSITCPDRVDSATGGSYFLVFLHTIHQQGDRLGLEVDVAVQGQQVGVLGLIKMRAVAASLASSSLLLSSPTKCNVGDDDHDRDHHNRDHHDYDRRDNDHGYNDNGR